MRSAQQRFTLTAKITAMSKLLLLSILVATIALPARAARSKSPKQGLKRALFHVAIFNAVYLLALHFLYGRL